MHPRQTPVPARLAACRRSARRSRRGLLVVLALLLPAPPGALANSYEKGIWTCTDFANVEQTYRSDPEDIYFIRGYARCLVTRGQGNDETRGMAMLHDLVEYSTHPARTGAAWMVANYIQTGGKLDGSIDKDNIIEAIKAYGKILFFIDLDPHYPWDGMDIYEETTQIELKSNRRIPLLYYSKFKYGAAGTHNAHKMMSPSYEGDRDLKTYPHYAPYTVEPLAKF